MGRAFFTAAASTALRNQTKSWRVEITMRRSRSDAMKRELYAEIARNLHEKVQVLPSDVFIFTHENDYPD